MFCLLWQAVTRGLRRHGKVKMDERYDAGSSVKFERKCLS